LWETRNRNADIPSSKEIEEKSLVSFEASAGFCLNMSTSKEDEPAEEGSSS
jgi:hypothetical protein